MIRRPRAVYDVSELPDVVFGNRDLMWWGTVGFIVIEGFTLVLCAAAFIYLHQNFAAWPPEGTMLPSLGAPIAQVVTMLASLPLMVWLKRVAENHDLAKTRLALTLASLFSIAFVGLRIVELTVSLNVKWNANAYGSAQWLVVACHGTLLLVSMGEIIGMCAMFWLAPIEKKHFGDASDAGLYWWFMVLAWLPLFVLCFLAPRWM